MLVTLNPTFESLDTTNSTVTSFLVKTFVFETVLLTFTSAPTINLHDAPLALTTKLISFVIF